MKTTLTRNLNTPFTLAAASARTLCVRRSCGAPDPRPETAGHASTTRDRVPGREGETVQRPALVFDGDCGFCTRSAAVARRVLPADCAVVPWQGADLASVGATAERAQQEVLWVPRTGDVVGGGPAGPAPPPAAGPRG